MNFKDLIGKTIVAAKQKKLKNYDDDGFLELQFSDNTKVIIIAFYDMNWTGHSQDEYPTRIYVNDNYNDELEDIKINNEMPF
jgi:hypothetical protein